MTTQVKLTLGIVLLLGLIALGVGFSRQGILPTTTTQPTKTTAKAINTTDIPFKLPDGFRIDTYAESLKRARTLTFDPSGVLLVSSYDGNKVIALPDRNNDGKADGNEVVTDQVHAPHGLLFMPNGKLLIAEDAQLSQWTYNPSTMKATFDKKLADLPHGDQGHSTRNVQLAADGKLYVNVGSSCNLCAETDPLRATVIRMNQDGSNVERWAWGLRNTAFFIVNPTTGDLWGNDMGRDNLGDTLPPDELNIIPTGNVTPPGDYGWPYCHSDRQPDPFGGLSVSCQTKTTGMYFGYPAHAAPLGLRFVPSGVGWPKEFEGNLLVSLHGSWNRTTKIGYEVALLKLDDKQKVTSMDDFLTGFIQGATDADVKARPVDLIFDKDGSLFISDDFSGRIFRVQPIK